MKLIKSNKKEEKSSKTTEKRRRSTRLKSKSKSDTIKQIEEDLLLTKINGEKENSNDDALVPKIEVCEPAVGISTVLPVSSENGSGGSAIESSEPIPSFRQITENEYLTERSFSKDAERMICDCVLTREEIIRGEKGCGEDCLNRLLLIECCSRCTLGERCTNKGFQKRRYAKCEVYRTKKKGHGLRILENVPSGTFIMEYVGEVLDADEFERRAVDYARGKIPHFYFMSLKSDCIIDATVKGNFSRFINHSCEPNAETQKWTVQGELRIGFFSKRDISAGEEITFDYQLQRYGKQAQRCYCEAPSCIGWIGEDPDKQIDDDKRKERKYKKKQEDQYLDLETALDEISQVGLINRHQTLSMNRLMVHAKELPSRMQILQLIEEGHPTCRRLFVDYHGLPIIWSWMVDCTSEQDELKIQLLKTLSALPITNKTILVDSKVYPLVEQWAFVVEQKFQSEELSAQSVLESVEDIASADETPVSEMAQKLLNEWSSLREAYKIPRKERIQQMKEHEREADQNVVKPRPRRLPLYAENIRDRYHRNRHNKNKDFEKIFFDRLNDYDKYPNNSFEYRKRKYSPDRRNFKVNNYVRNDGMTKQKHRFMFEMKVAREEERRRWVEEEEQQQQQQYYQSLFYTPSPVGQYIANVPSSTYAADPNMIQNIQSITSTFYATPPTSMYTVPPNIVMSHIPPPASQASQTPQLISTSVNVSPQTYYQNNVPISFSCNSTPAPVPYPHQALAELRINSGSQRADTVDTESFSYSHETLQNQLQQHQVTPLEEIPVPNEEQTYAEYNESTPTSVTEINEQFAVNYTTDDNFPIVNAAAVDITKLQLPPKWKAARDSEGRIYYYHKKTRVSQWYPPSWENSQAHEEVEETEVDESTEGESSAEENQDEIIVTKKRKRKIDYNFEPREKNDETIFDETLHEMDADIKENLAAMSSEFQDSENEDYSPINKKAEQQKINSDVEKKPSPDIESSSPVAPTSIPLITEHIISPREAVDKKERIRTKRKIKILKERRRKKKQQRMMSVLNHASSVAGGCSNGNSNTANNIISSSSSRLVSVPADTSSITERKKKDAFRTSMANFVVHCLNPYFRSSCTLGRITNYYDFKYLARKLTNFVELKELKHCGSVTDLSCNSSVKHKAKEYIRKYMSKFGEVYVRPADE